jgi:NADPH:quinone reductase-like Zn-dependent oxidoreductase
MKAMVIHRYGEPNVFELEDVEPPRPGPDQVLVKVHGSSVNPLDAGIRAGMLKSFVHLKLAAVLGVDVSGEVVEVGEKVKRFAVGDRVFAYTGVGAGGGYGELAVVAEESLAPVPENLDLVEAGTVPGVGATAYEAFSVHAPLSSGMRVFVNGAAGGVGTYAIQVARAMGADVAGTCSTAKAEVVSKLGAEVVDYTKGDPFAQKEKFDVVLNAVRGADEAALRGLLKNGGTLVTVVGEPVDMATSKLGNLVRSTKVIPFFVSSKSTCLEGLSKLIEDGKVELIVEKIYPLVELREAHRRVETGRVTGKVCIDVRSIWQ